MSETVIIEHTVAFRVGRRRFLTRRAAFRFLARQRIAEKYPCFCGGPEYDHRGQCIDPGDLCGRHENYEHFEKIEARYAQLMMHADKRMKVKP